MGQKQSSKKTDKIEVRLSPETKQAFHETCEQQGETASGAIRRLIEEYVARFHQPVIARPIEAIRRTPWWVRGGGLAALMAGAVGLTVLPSSAEPEPVWKVSFDRQDKNQDGFLTIDEYLPLRYGGNEMDQEAAKWIRTSAIKGLQDIFDSADKDLDGELTEKEFQLQYLLFASDTFEIVDADQDGVVSLKEFSTPQDFFSRAAVSMMARGLALNQEAARQEIDRTEVLHWVAGDINVAPSALTFRIGQVFQKIDADSDEMITREEFLAR